MKSKKKMIFWKIWIEVKKMTDSFNKKMLCIYYSLPSKLLNLWLARTSMEIIEDCYSLNRYSKIT